MCECGRPKHECHDPANRGLYQVADGTCFALAAVEEHTGQKGFKPDPGQRFYATEIDEDLITRRAFAPLPDPDNAGDETGEGDDRGEGV